jgi:hypothetical protein
MKQCQQQVFGHYTQCEKPAVCSIDWPDGDGVTKWYCAEHYDLLIAGLRKSGRIALLKGQHA